MLREYDDVEPLILSVGEDEEVSIEEVAKAITRAFGIEGQYKFDTSRADGQFRKPATNAKLLSLVGSDLKFTPFDEALQETVDWFLQNYETARTGKKWTRRFFLVQPRSVFPLSLNFESFFTDLGCKFEALF